MYNILHKKIQVKHSKNKNTKGLVLIMKLMEERILEEAQLLDGGIIKVDGFLNHRMDIALIDEVGKEFYKIFGNLGVTQILTVEASGIGIACLTARYFNVPVIFAKKSDSKNLVGELYTSEVYSFTKGKSYTVRVEKKFLNKNDKILLIDDFLANGKALLGLLDICSQAGAEVVGAGICIEKNFQDGGDKIRKMGINLHSMAVIDFDENGKLYFVQKENQ
jgi:xanthine phosphoribosyltransferase